MEAKNVQSLVLDIVNLPESDSGTQLPPKKSILGVIKFVAFACPVVYSIQWLYGRCQPNAGLMPSSIQCPLTLLTSLYQACDYLGPAKNPHTENTDALPTQRYLHYQLHP